MMPSIRYRTAAATSAFVPVVFILLTISFHGFAHAESCLELVERIAERHRLSIDPPDARGGVTSDQLTKSGGVVDPPAVDGSAVIRPPRDRRSRMETTPDIGVDPPAAARGLPPSLGAGDRMRLESILVAARHAATSGNERACFERLREAREIVSRN